MRWSKARKIQIILSFIWLLDGALQLQPRMFTSAFANQIIIPAGQGQPGFVAALIHFGARIFLTHPAVFDTLFALIQLAIGILILVPRTLKIGLALAIGWGLIVWSFGEAFGGIFSGQTLFLMGAPGAALLYIIIALAVYPRKKSSRLAPAYWLALVWLALWVGGGIYQLLPANNSNIAFGSMISSNASGAPSWLAAADNSVGKIVSTIGVRSSAVSTSSSSGMSMGMGAAATNGTSNRGFLFILALGVIQMAVGVGVLFSGWRRKLALGTGIALALAFWVFGQSMGAIYSGLGTDPNSGPLFVLLAIAILLCPDIDQNLTRIAQRIELWLTGRAEPKAGLVIEPALSDN